MIFNINVEYAKQISQVSILPIGILIFIINFIKTRVQDSQTPLIPYDLIFLIMLNLIFGFQISRYIKQYIPEYVQLFIRASILIIQGSIQIVKIIKNRNRQEIKQKMMISQLLNVINENQGQQGNQVVQMRQSKKNKRFNLNLKHLKQVNKNRGVVFVLSGTLTIMFCIFQQIVQNDWKYAFYTLNFLQLSASILFEQLSIIKSFNNKETVLLGFQEDKLNNKVFTFLSYYCTFSGCICELIDIGPSLMLVPVFIKLDMEQSEIYACSNIFMLVASVIDLSQTKVVLSSELYITVGVVSVCYLLTQIIALKFIRIYQKLILRLVYSILLIASSGLCIYLGVKQIKQQN